MKLQTLSLFLFLFLNGHLLAQQSASFKLGIENLSPDLVAWLTSQRVGLVMNHSSRTQHGKPSVDVLREHAIPLVALLAPEHGTHGNTPAARAICDGFDDATHIPIISLYGSGTGKKITQETADMFDVFIFDIQDSGMRHYTYISTLLRVLEAAAHFGKSVVVLDRPNPLGKRTEGPLVEPTFESFISIAPIPLRHGMTVGELARYFNANVLNTPAQLRVVPMQGYHRSFGLPAHVQAHLSPNLVNHNACYAYSFLGLLGEIRPFDVGIGSDKAFECLLLPEALGVKRETWQALSGLLLRHNIKSSFFSHFSQRKKKRLAGLRLAIENINTVESWAAFLTIVNHFKKAGVKLEYSPTFDKAAGTDKVRNFLQGSYSYTKLIQNIERDLKTFTHKAKTVYLYPHSSA